MAVSVSLYQSTIMVDASNGSESTTIQFTEDSFEFDYVIASLSGDIGYNADWCNANLSTDRIRKDKDSSSESADITVVCADNLDETKSREAIVTSTWLLYGYTYDEILDKDIETYIGTSRLELTVIQAPKEIEVKPTEVGADFASSMTDDKLAEARAALQNIKEKIMNAALAVLGSIINIGAEFINEILKKLGKLEEIYKALKAELDAVREARIQSQNNIAKLQAKVKVEQGKKKPNQDKIDLLNERIAELEKLEKEYADSESKLVEEGIDNENAFYTAMIEKLKTTILGCQVIQHVNNIVVQSGVIAKAVPALVTNSATVAVEPMGAVVVTPLGPGAIPANVIQTLGQIQRLCQQAAALNVPLNSALDSAVFLGLDESMVTPLTSLSAPINVLSALA